jgi:FKBP-type peptidyl-prolyl cis-trans isomerase 2
MKKRNVTLFALLLAGSIAMSFLAASSEGAEKENKEEAVVVSEGKSIKVNYTLTVDGKVVDSSKERGPLEVKAGSHQLIPGFEKALMGMKVGEKKSFKVSPEEGYGPEDPRGIQDIPKDQLPPEITPKAGMVLTARGKDGQSMPVRIVEVKEDVVIINFNHPLAGKTLNFDVEVVDIK